MDKEYDIIRMIAGQMPRSINQLNELFDSDAEVVRFNGSDLLFNIDSYSKEDRFCEREAYVLGWNVCCCTISDILASGGIPLYYAHSLTYGATAWNKEYIQDFSRGINDVLRLCNTSFIGGDLGKSDDWSYTGVAIGETKERISRKGAGEGDVIYATGFVGKGNLMAAEQLVKNNLDTGTNHKRFEIRLRESQLISQYASSCIDTSDGFINALNVISQINNTGYWIENIPYLPIALDVFKQLDMFKEILFLGECGEYELLFTIGKDKEAQFCDEAKKRNLRFVKVGRVVGKGEKTLRTTNGVFSIADFNLDARSYSNIEDYLNDLVAYAASLNG